MGPLKLIADLAYLPVGALPVYYCRLFFRSPLSFQLYYSIQIERVVELYTDRVRRESRLRVDTAILE